MGDESRPQIGVNWLQVAGSALAAVSSAVLLSTLGVAGTVIGAALGSVVATIGTAFYTRTLDVSTQQVTTQAAALRRVSRARSEIDKARAAMDRGDDVSEAGIARAGRELDQAEEALAAVSTEASDDLPDGLPEDVRDEPGPSGVPPSGRRFLAPAWPGGPSWRRLAVLATAVFLVAMGVITAFELTTGQAVSVYTGGSDDTTDSTVPGLGRRADRPTPSPSDTPTSNPTENGSESSSSSPTESPTSADEPTAEPTDTPSDTATSSPTPTSTPTPSPAPELTVLPSSTPTG